jgi:ATP adenylyltransferase
MKILWAPWRMAYITRTNKPARCLFCAKTREHHDAANLLLHRGRRGFVMMNRYPYNSGHLMVAPYAHVNTLEALAPDESLELMQLTTLALRVLREEIRPEGFNLGVNLGRVGGAGIEEHVHLHIVPRWNGDTNFMPLFADIRVIPEHLRQTYRKLRARFRMLHATLPAARARRNAAGDGRATPRRRPRR